MKNNPVNRTVLLIGANEGDRIRTFSKCRIMLDVLAGKIASCSDVYSTSPWGVTDQNDFINQAIILHTTLSPTDLLAVTQDIEKRLGKNKLTHWGPRHIDIDIILYEDHIIDQKDLTIPHSQMANRRFVLIPLAQIASEWLHPISKLSVSAMLERCKDTGHVNKIDQPR